MPLMISNVECAVVCDGRALIIERPKGKHAAGLLAFPGGKVEASDAQGSADILTPA